MKDRTARILAVIALVFMAAFIVTLIMTLVDHTLLYGSIGYVSLCAGVFTLMIFIALKADGRGFSMTKINNDIEMEKIEKELEAREKAKAEDPSDGDDENAEDGGEEKDAYGNDGDTRKEKDSGGENA